MRPWKRKLQRFADQTGPVLTVTHLPPGSGIHVSDAEMAALHIRRNAFHGQRDHTRSPRQQAPRWGGYFTSDPESTMIMPTELRQITFSNDELRSALDDYLLRRSISLSSGAITGLRWDDGDKEHVVLEIADTRTQQIQQVILTSRDVGAATLRYCLLKNIPMPRASTKSLAISGDNLVLELRSGGTRSIGQEAG